MIIKELYKTYEELSDLIEREPVFKKVKGLSTKIKDQYLYVNDKIMALNLSEYKVLTKANYKEVFKEYHLVLEEELRMINEHKEILYNEFETSFNELKKVLTNKNLTVKDTIKEANKLMKEYAQESLTKNFFPEKIIQCYKNTCLNFNKPYSNNERPTNTLNLLGKQLYNHLSGLINQATRKLHKQLVIIDNYQLDKGIKLTTRSNCDLCYTKVETEEIAMIDCGRECYCLFHLECINEIAAQKSTKIMGGRHVKVVYPCKNQYENLKQKIDDEEYDVFRIL